MSNLSNMSRNQRISPQRMQIMKYADAVFAERLREEGFVSRDNNKVHWYRIVGEEIIQTVFFYTRHTCANNILLNIGYGIHPSFTRPIYLSGVCLRDAIINREIFAEQPLIERKQGGAYRFSPYSDDISVVCPEWGSKGLYTFDGVILPKMEKAKTIEECYQLHVQKYENMTFYPLDVRYNSISKAFIDEAIYLQDESRYHHCRRRLNWFLSYYSEQESFRQLKKEEHEEKQHAQWQLLAIDGGKRDEYLGILEDRRQRNLSELEKKVGIKVK